MGHRGWGVTCKNGKKVKRFNERCGSCCFDLKSIASGSVYTYVSEKNGCSYLDHCVGTNSLYESVNLCHVWEECLENLSDHIPITCSVKLNMVRSGAAYGPGPGRMLWERLSEDQMRQMYSDPLQKLVHDLLLTYGISDISTYCISPNLSNESVVHILESCISLMLDQAHKVIPRSKFHIHLKPYWVKDLTVLSSKKMAMHVSWVKAGKPRTPGNASWEEYKTAKKEFKQHQRRITREYEEKEENKLKETQFVDQAYFWYLVNKTRKLKNTSSSIRSDEGEILTEPQDIVEEWARYFERLGNLDGNDDYDDAFKCFVEEELRSCDISDLIGSVLFDTPFTLEEVKSLIDRLQKKKAPGWDRVSTEHIIHGGTVVLHVVTCIFNHLRMTSTIPDHFKKGIRIPVFKGGKRDNLNKDDHRGITLLPIISKLYEMALMSRSEGWFLSKLDVLQGAARKGASCLDSALILREAIAHATENGSAAYVVLLDVRKAFDTVWVDGLLFQLRQLGVDKALWWTIKSYYTNFHCCVSVGGTQSRWFKVTQGVHQGAVSSMMLYATFINSRLVELREAGVGCYIGNTYVGSPCFADDQALVALFPKSQQIMVDICHRHSCKWRYGYQVKKSMCLTFSGNPCVVVVGDDVIPNVESAVHMGVGLHKYGSQEARNYTEARITRARRSFYPMLSVARSGSLINPVLASKLYFDVCMNSMIFGAELWDLHTRDMQVLESAHIQMARTVQGLPHNVANVGVLIAIGWSTIQVLIHKKRCMYMARTLQESSDTVGKRITLQRLCMITSNSKDRTSSSIISPVRMMKQSCLTLGLIPQLQSAIQMGGVQNLSLWKQEVKEKAKTLEMERNLVKVATHRSLKYLTPLVPIMSISFWWTHADKYPKLRSKCKRIVGMMLGYLPGVDFKNNRKCPLCNPMVQQDGVVHLLWQCQNPQIVALRYKMVSIASENCPQITADRDIILYQCLSGDIAPESRTPLCFTLDSMFKIRLQAMHTNP